MSEKDMDALKQSVLRAQMAKPLPAPVQPGRAQSNTRGAVEMAVIDARFSALDNKLDVLIHMLKPPRKRPGTSPCLAVTDIRRVVTAFFDITDEELDRHKRSRRIARIRQIAFYLSRTHTTLSFTEIGKAFHRDHTTIVHGVHAISALRKVDTAVEQELSRLEAQLVDLLARRSAA